MSTPLVQSTVTTQISQAHLYNQNEANLANCINELTAQNNVANSSTPNAVNKPIPVVPLITASNVSSLRRLHSMPTQCEGDIIPIPIMRTAVAKPPVPERNAELIMKVGKRIPPPPPPRTSSRSPLASPTSPNVPQIMPTVNETEAKDGANAAIVTAAAVASSSAAVDSGGETSSGNESGNDSMQRQVALEMRHQELLKKQKVLQEQYQRLQQMSKMPSVDMTAAAAAAAASAAGAPVPLQKMGSESNIQQKISLTLTPAAGDNGQGGNTTTTTLGVIAPGNGPSSLVANEKIILNRANSTNGGTTGTVTNTGSSGTNTTTTKQVYETEIL
ncbi:coiled-coil domain-containing protein CG32809-like [Musca vetustissima]|uniref:coiled-coil domain-containing protein CG32809-like n=1 Tax=Musca vetustissima TaxID=27455 RepID=UPI002AB5FC84|nr:coiled-coil domain-containing protein CG32809-like [Musca vetustissima]